MPKRIKVTPAALKDIQNGVDYYNQQQKGLGRKFEDLVHSTFSKIVSMPLSASFAYENVRYKVAENFPYIILYEIDEADIRILRVYHTSLSPDYL